MQTTRKELIEARERIKRQIEILENPVRFYDSYPEGIAKLGAPVAEIKDCLAKLPTEEAEK